MKRFLWLFLLVASVWIAAPVQARPRQPDYLLVIGSPQQLARFWHDQRGAAGDEYACALYAQASVLEALGYDFQAELDRARTQGMAEGWYRPAVGTIGLGQPLRTHEIPFVRFGSPVEAPIPPERALYWLQRQLSAGRYVIANLDATRLTYYRNSAITYHTLWITGLRLDTSGRAITVFANDSYRGAAVEYPIAEFLAAWGGVFNFYAIVVER